MFKDSYLSYLQEQLSNLVTPGYTVKVIEEYDYGAPITPKFMILCVVKYMVGSKQTNASDRINQPVMFTIKTEGDDFRETKALFDNFFLTYSKTHTNLTIDNANYDVWQNYNTPVVQTGIENVGGHHRATIIMTGVISYSLEKIIGVKYYLKPYDDNIPYMEVMVINPQAQYNTQPITPQVENYATGKARIQGANNIFTFQLLAGKDDISLDFLRASFLGSPDKYSVKVVYSDQLFFEIDCIVTLVANIHDTATGDNVINVTLMPLR